MCTLVVRRDWMMHVMMMVILGGRVSGEDRLKQVTLDGRAFAWADWTTNFMSKVYLFNAASEVICATASEVICATEVGRGARYRHSGVVRTRMMGLRPFDVDLGVSGEPTTRRHQHGLRGEYPRFLFPSKIRRKHPVRRYYHELANH